MVSVAKNKQKPLASQWILGRPGVKREFALSALYPFTKSLWKWFFYLNKGVGHRKERTWDTSKRRLNKRKDTKKILRMMIKKTLGWHLSHACKNTLRAPLRNFGEKGRLMEYLRQLTIPRYDFNQRSINSSLWVKFTIAELSSYDIDHKV